MFEPYEDIGEWVKYTRTIEPDPNTLETYDKYYNKYLELYRRNKDLMHQMHALV